MKIYNDSSYSFTAFINGREYIINKKAAIEFDYHEPTRVDLISRKKNRVFLNILDLNFSNVYRRQHNNTFLL